MKGFEGTRRQLRAHDCIEHLKGIVATLSLNLEKEKSEHKEARLKLQEFEQNSIKEKGELELLSIELYFFLEKKFYLCKF